MMVLNNLWWSEICEKVLRRLLNFLQDILKSINILGSYCKMCFGIVEFCFLLTFYIVFKYLNKLVLYNNRRVGVESQ